MPQRMNVPFASDYLAVKGIKDIKQKLESISVRYRNTN